MPYDVVIVGGGPGGYPAAILLGRKGYKVALIEKNLLGGECTNYGCVPTKALLNAAKTSNHLREYDWIKGGIEGKAVFDWIREIVSETRKGIRHLLEASGVEIFDDEALSINNNCIRLRSGKELCGQKGVLLAIGSDPVLPSGFSVDGVRVHDNRTLLETGEPPESILVVGAGYVGVEFSYALSGLGSDVYLVEILGRPLPQMDRDIGMLVRQVLSRQGVKQFFKTSVQRIDVDDRVNVSLKRQGEVQGISVSSVLFATGRRPRRIKGISSSGVRIDDRGFIKTDCSMRTSNPRIYAAGDVAGPPLLAHKAIVESIVAAENIAGNKYCLKDLVIPQVVYIEPEIVEVSTGLDPGKEYEYVKIRTDALARSRIEGSPGFVKLVYEKDSGRIVKIILAYSNASESAGEAARIIARRLTIMDLEDGTVHPHPTLSEAFAEAYYYASGKHVHVIGGIKKKYKV
ncbi:MAG: NAD(P)/FAD-dependent oxidoreductase [Desulfurococcales archaeon]|nr:NAD(P)/FAD-dependent oxidoreductase [Desulfurococcales archaeon]